MIWESHYWKQPLPKSATWLKRVRLGNGTRESTYVRIEREVFFGFYSIRKLLDTCKLTTEVRNITFDLFVYQNLKKVGYLNWHHVDKLYNLDQQGMENRKLRFICNLFVHSYVFLVVEGESGRIEGFYITTDTDKNKKLFFISLDCVCTIFRRIGRDYPSRGKFFINPKTGEQEHFAA